MTNLLILLSILSAMMGVLSLSDATFGIGMIALGCYIGIVARLVQAEVHRQPGKTKAHSEAA